MFYEQLLKEALERPRPIHTTNVDENKNWNEEDDVKLKDVIGIIENSGYVVSIQEHYIFWLKSLKERLKGE